MIYNRNKKWWLGSRMGASKASQNMEQMSALCKLQHLSCYQKTTNSRMRFHYFKAKQKHMVIFRHNCTRFFKLHVFFWSVNVKSWYPGLEHQSRILTNKLSFPSLGPTISLINDSRSAASPYSKHFSTTLDANLCWLSCTIRPNNLLIIRLLSWGFPLSNTCCQPLKYIY